MQKFPLDILQREEDPDLWDLSILQEKEAFDFGFYWKTLGQLLDQVRSETHEIKEAFEAQDPRHLQEEIGDLILAAIGVSIFCGCDPKETMALSLQKFDKRLACMKKIAREDGHTTLKGYSLEVLLDYWERSKKETVS